MNNETKSVLNTMKNNQARNLDRMISFCGDDFPTILDNMNYHIENDGMYITTSKQENDQNIYETLSVEVSEKDQKVVVKKHTRCEENMETIGYDPIACYVLYDVIDTQKVTEYQVEEGRLNVKTASIVQAVKENTAGIGNYVIVDFNSIADFQDEAKLQDLPFSNSGIEQKRKSYEIPKDYKITDGLAGVKPIDSTFQKTKK